MHEIVFHLAALWLALLVVACAVLMLRAGSTASRVLALDTLVLILVGPLVLWSSAEAVSYFLDAALVLAMLAFLATVAAARFHESGKVF